MVTRTAKPRRGMQYDSLVTARALLRWTDTFKAVLNLKTIDAA